jgi:hypothetical protein
MELTVCWVIILWRVVPAPKRTERSWIETPTGISAEPNLYVINDEADCRRLQLCYGYVIFASLSPQLLLTCL